MLYLEIQRSSFVTDNAFNEFAVYTRTARIELEQRTNHNQKAHFLHADKNRSRRKEMNAQKPISPEHVIIYCFRRYAWETLLDVSSCRIVKICFFCGFLLSSALYCQQLTYCSLLFTA